MFEDLSDSALTARAYDMCKNEREQLVDFVWVLVALHKRKVVLAMGFSSLFAFCTEYLGLSKGETWRRTEAAKLFARFPLVSEYLFDRRLTLETLVELRDVLEEARLQELLDRAAGRTLEEVEQLVVTLKPQPAPPDLFRKLPAPRAEAVPKQLEFGLGPGRVEGSREVPAPERPAGTIKPISAEQHVLRITVSADFKADLDALKEELSHKLPGGTLEELLHDCVRERLKVCRRRRRGAGRKTTVDRPPRHSRDYPAAVRNGVWKRDGGQCTFVGITGHRCSSRYRLQFHHLDPHGKGGVVSVENLTLRCQAHNLYAAEQDYGAEHVAQAILHSRSKAKERCQTPTAEWLRGVEDCRPGSCGGGQARAGARRARGDGALPGESRVRVGGGGAVVPGSAAGGAAAAGGAGGDGAGGQAAGDGGAARRARRLLR